MQFWLVAERSLLMSSDVKVTSLQGRKRWHFMSRQRLNNFKSTSAQPKTTSPWRLVDVGWLCGYRRKHTDQLTDFMTERDQTQIYWSADGLFDYKYRLPTLYVLSVFIDCWRKTTTKAAFSNSLTLFNVSNRINVKPEFCWYIIFSRWLRLFFLPSNKNKTIIA